MSTCHQAHNIPWNTLLEVFHKSSSSSAYYFESHDKYGVQDLVFTPDEEGHVFKKLRFFASKFEAAIVEFSKTERQKYKDEDIDKITEICEKELCNEYLPENLSKLSQWESIINGSSIYQGDDLDAMRELFIQGKTESLLCLARKGLPFEKYQFVTYSNFFHYGLGRIKEDCLALYIHLNLLLATGTLCNPEKWYGQWIMFRDREILSRYDGNPHARMYLDYFVKNPKFEDLEGMQQLLKRLFRTLYVYDMVMRERGRSISWEIDEVLPCLGCFKERTKSSYNLFWGQINKLRNNCTSN